MFLYPENWKDDAIIKRYIYALVDPRPHETTIYIGHTKNYKRRYREHTYILDATMPKMYLDWLMELSMLSLKPKMIILENDELTLYEVVQFESIWIQVAMNNNYKVVNSEKDKERAINNFDGLKQLANVRSIPIDYLEGIRKIEEYFFFLPNEYIKGVEGVYAHGIDFSIKRRIEIREILEELVIEYREKDDEQMIGILTSDYEETRKNYDHRKQMKLEEERYKIGKRAEQILTKKKKS